MGGRGGGGGGGEGEAGEGKGFLAYYPSSLTYMYVYVARQRGHKRKKGECWI